MNKWLVSYNRRKDGLSVCVPLALITLSQDEVLALVWDLEYRVGHATHITSMDPRAQGPSSFRWLGFRPTSAGAAE